MISGRAIQLAVPEGTTAAQWGEIHRAISYRQGKNVTVIATPAR
jgi:hypothetical protein